MTAGTAAAEPLVGAGAGAAGSAARAALMEAAATRTAQVIFLASMADCDCCKEENYVELEDGCFKVFVVVPREIGGYIYSASFFFFFSFFEGLRIGRMPIIMCG